MQSSGGIFSRVITLTSQQLTIDISGMWSTLNLLSRLWYLHPNVTLNSQKWSQIPNLVQDFVKQQIIKRQTDADRSRFEIPQAISSQVTNCRLGSCNLTACNRQAASSLAVSEPSIDGSTIPQRKYQIFLATCEIQQRRWISWGIFTGPANLLSQFKTPGWLVF